MKNISCELIITYTTFCLISYGRASQRPSNKYVKTTIILKNMAFKLQKKLNVHLKSKKMFQST